MAHNDLLITHLGYKAEGVINRISNAAVFGKSERGIFLQPLDDLTLYISFENFRGPLTLNLTGDSVLLDQVKSGNPVKVKKSGILFPNLGLKILLDGAETWSHNTNPITNIPDQDQLKSVVGQAKKILGNESLFPLLEMVISGDPAPLPDHPGLIEKVIHVLDEMRDGSLGQSKTTDLLNAITGLIGAGPGLTPLGDDIILGILLAFNYRKESIFPEISLEDLNQMILDAAREKTTNLSFSLLTCAVEGSADERTLKILDRLITGEEIRDQDLTQLLKWGSSSGIAVLAGMISAIKKDPVSL